ncbi:MAG: OmpP1/FadL family transporter [Thermodesulfobacteriota bacterium]|nr:OmpP1/FadL family transporter [Thermodesulfobacteriota bacterium]
MMKKSWFFQVAFAGLGLLLAASMAQGAGFALYEGSARGNALGGTLVGRADDPSALYYNPAGITQLPGTQFMGGATIIYPKADVVTLSPSGKTSTETESNTFFPPHLYSTYQMGESVWLGLGVYSRFGLGTEYDDDWPGKYNIYKAFVETLSVNPNVAFKVSDELSLAAGVSAVWLDLELEQKILTPAGDVDQELTGDDWGYGYNLAAHYKACDWMTLGLSYTSEVDQKARGDAKFDKPAIPDLDPVFNNTGVRGDITLPDMVFMGVTLYPADRWSLEFDAIWTGWSDYDALVIEYDSFIAVDPNTGVPITKVAREKDWDDVWRFQVGVEYKATDWLDLRLGYVFDESPVPDETADYLIPTEDRQLYSIGCGIHWDAWVVDLSYTYLESDTRTVAARPDEGIFPSEFEDGYTHLVGVSVGYTF